MVKVNDITVQQPVGVQEKRTGCGQFEAVYNCYNKVLSVTHRHLHAWCQAKQNIMNILQSLQFTLLNFLPNAIPVPLFAPFLFFGINFSQGSIATCMSCGETLKFNSWSNGTISQQHYSWNQSKYQWLSPEFHNVFKVTTGIQLEEVAPFRPVQRQTTVFVNSSQHTITITTTATEHSDKNCLSVLALQAQSMQLKLVSHNTN